MMTLTKHRKALLPYLHKVVDADVRNTYRKSRTQHNHLKDSNAEKKENSEDLDATPAQIKRWLDESPEEEPWTGMSYRARNMQKDGK